MPSAISPNHDLPSSNKPPQPSNRTPRRLKLNMSSPDPRGSTEAVASAPPRDYTSQYRSNSPPRPSYSPVTPTLPHSALPPMDSAFHLPSPTDHRSSWQTVPEWIDHPESAMPLALDENPDAIALRAAISILQLQKQQAIRDMKTLDRMKRLAKERPEAFLEDLKAGKLSKTSLQDIDLDDDAADGDEEDDQTEGGIKAPDELDESAHFGQFPTAQNVIRAPPIEWKKYHVIGEPLNRLHEQQKQRPGSIEINSNGNEIMPQAHAIAAPYRPFSDKLDWPEPRPRHGN